MTGAPETNVWGPGDEFLESRNQLGTIQTVAIWIQCMNEFWISTMTISINVAWDVSSSPNDRMFMFWYVRGEEHYNQIWRLEGVETDGWNLWDVYHYEIVAVHWASDGNAKTEITMRYLHSYWWQGVYESPSQD
jgi:hypothetical protein